MYRELVQKRMATFKREEKRKLLNVLENKTKLLKLRKEHIAKNSNKWDDFRARREIAIKVYVAEKS